jgi:hypothetical protein
MKEALKQALRDLGIAEIATNSTYESTMLIREALAQPPLPAQEQWLQAVTIKIEAALLSHRLSLHNDADDDGVGFPLVDALCCGQTSLDIGKREVEDIAEAIYHVLAANTPPAAQPAQKPQISTEELIYMTGVYDGKVLEREACAKVCESYLSESPHSWGGTTMAAAIRARGNT